MNRELSLPSSSDWSQSSSPSSRTPDAASSDRPARAVTAAATPTIAVVVPVRNEERFIARTIDGLLAQDYPAHAVEIAVVDGESTDATRRIVSEYAARYDRVRLYENPKRWSSAARNIGIRASRSDFSIVVDGHCERLRPSYLRDVVDAFERSNADCIGRPQPLDVSGASAVQRAIATARGCWLGHHPSSYIFSSGEGVVPAHSVAVAYRRAVFDKIGYFDETFDACEDVELNHRVDRADLTCFWTDRIALPYVPRGTMRGLFRQMVRYGRGRLRLMRKHRDQVSLKTLVPALFVAGLAVGPLAAALSRPLAIAFAATLAVYLAIVVVTSAMLAGRSRRPRLFPLVAAAFFFIHVGAGWGILVELFKGRPRKKADAEKTRRAPIETAS